jgi:carboxymethylenebutenolidase
MKLEPNIAIALQRPLSRCERGPGLILIRPLCYADCQKHNDSLDPEPLLKWAEESFATVQVTFGADASNAATVQDRIRDAKGELTTLEECTAKNRYGLISSLNL